VGVSIQFDPFRFNQDHRPAPVDGPLMPLRLIEDDEEPLAPARPSWLKSVAVLVTTSFLISTCWSLFQHVFGS
jgi:hypothetical protein